ncbi:EipA family protein [uncultured Sphingomonas sp.]|uniref:EipA family protein n=1 Tax=uncultured Sphingomonas sp. TaxID=158754 RepID=UPI0037480EF9
MTGVQKFAHMLALVAMAAGPMTAQAQVRTIDPNSAIDADLAPRTDQTRTTPPAATSPYSPPAETPVPSPSTDPAPAGDTSRTTGTGIDPMAERTTAAEASGTYKRDDVLTAAEGVFGKGAQGLAGMVEKVLKDQGEPNAYIAGREVSGAFVVGLRYGSGVMTHRVEGTRQVYWTGPSLGFDVGGDASKVFVLVYNLYDTQDLFHRFPAGEGRVFFIGGFAATYLRRGNTVVIPIRLGVGWRLGANVGYMRFSEKSRWLPF